MFTLGIVKVNKLKEEDNNDNFSKTIINIFNILFNKGQIIVINDNGNITEDIKGTKNIFSIIENILILKKLLIVIGNDAKNDIRDVKNNLIILFLPFDIILLNSIK